MKKSFIMALASLFFLGSCSEEKLVENTVSTEGKDVLMASFESRNSRSTVSQNSLLWSESDQIAVLGTEETKAFTLFDGAGTTAGRFEGTLPTSPVGVAFPYTEENEPVLIENMLTMTLPNVISDITKCNLPMWASLDGTYISFKHLVGLLAFTVNDIPTGYNKLVLEASNAITGEFTADVSLNEIALVAAPNTNTVENKKLTVDFSNSPIVSEEDNDRLFYIPLPVGSYSKIKVTIGNNTEMKDLVEWTNKTVRRARIYRVSKTYVTIEATTTTGVTEALEAQYKEEGSDDVTAPEAPAQIDLQGQINTSEDEEPIVIPAAAEGSTSDISMNFNEAPVTSADQPLIIEQNKEAEVGEASNELTINMPADAEIESMEINTPTTTTTLNGGTYKKLTVRTATNTFIIGSDVTIWGLEISGGNIRIQNGGKITNSISKFGEDPNPVTIILETGATIENSLPANFEEGNDFIVVNAAEYDLQQAILRGGEVVLSEDVELLGSLEISNTVSIDLNGKSVKCKSSDVFVVLANGKLILNDANNTAVVWGSEDNSSSSCAVWAKGGEIIINGGIYKVGHDNSSSDPTNKRNDCIYVGTNNGTNPGGSITINDGVFEYTGTEAGGNEFLLNLADNDTNNPTIIVQGGKFKNFNPADNTAEGEGTCFIDKIRYESKLVSENPSVYEIVPNGFVEAADGSYEINDAAGLRNFATLVEAGNTFAGKTIKLNADINLIDGLWTPIGAARSTANLNDTIFEGTFDGQNHIIKNLNVNTTEYRFLGLFATVHGATIKNLSIAGGEIKAVDNANASVYAGAFVGRGSGVTLINCHNKGCLITVERTDNQRGGWIGGIIGSITYLGDINPVCIACTNSATITSPYIPSGIAGGAFGGKVSYVACANTGDIVVTDTYQPTNAFASGMVGEMGGTNYMYSCFSDCSIPAGTTHGALAGDGAGCGPNVHYSYTTNGSVNILGQLWSTINETVSVVSSYNEAVENLNKGIELYNETATVPCNYRFVSATVPTLEVAE